jgi:hypothetical protein
VRGVSVYVEAEEDVVTGVRGSDQGVGSRGRAWPQPIAAASPS